MDAINQTVKDKGYAFLTADQKAMYNQTQPAPKVAPVQSSNVISASALNAPSPLPPIPTQQPDTTNYNAVTASLTPATTNFTAPTTQVDGQLSQAKGTSQGLIDRISQLYGDVTGKSTFQAEQEAQLGIPQQQRDLQELTNSLNAIKTEQTLTPIKIQQEFAGRGATAGGVAPIESARNRENAIQALTVSAQMQAKQGNLTLALEQAERATGLKYKAIEDEITAKEKQLALLDKYTLTPLQEEQKRQQELKLAEQKQTLILKKASEEDFNKNMLSAQQSGMTNLETKQARDLFNAGDIDGANQIVAKYALAEDKGFTLNAGQTRFDAQGNRIASVAEKLSEGSNPSTTPVVDSVGNTLEYGTPEYVVQRLLGTSQDKTNPVASEREQLGKFSNVIAQTSNLVGSLKGTDTGPIIGYLKGINPYNFDARAVNAQLQALVPGVARGVYGEVGVLTDSDIKNYMKTLPGLRSTKQQNEFVALMTLQNARRSYESTLLNMANSGVNVSGFVDSYRNITKRVDELETSLGVKKAEAEIAPEELDIFDSVVGNTQQSSGFFSGVWKGLTGK